MLYNDAAYLYIVILKMTQNCGLKIDVSNRDLYNTLYSISWFLMCGESIYGLGFIKSKIVLILLHKGHAHIIR